MDPLSDICSLLHVKIQIAAELRLGGSWAIRTTDQTERNVTLCATLEGEHWLTVDGLDAPVHIEQGDCYLIGTNVTYLKSSTQISDPAQYKQFHEGDIAARLQCIEAAFPHTEEHGNTLVGARFVLDEICPSPLTDLLPPLIHVRAESEAAPILRSMLSALKHETTKSRIGTTVMIDHLTRIIFVHAIRAYVAQEARPKGWLGGLVDAKIGRALAMMHRDVTKRWSVDDLATAAGMSRSSFALRFKVLVGQTPLDYWLQLRMRSAARLLRSGNKTVSSVAFALGYESEKSFGKAFKRVMGSPPAWYRRAGAASANDVSADVAVA